MLTAVVLCICSTRSPSTVEAVDRSKPESVLRAYFASWGSGDWGAKNSFLKHGRTVPEPVESIRVLTLQRLENSPTRYLYYVAFEIKVKGRGVSMESGRYDWTYELTWDERRQSWIITNYGAG
jgi:hypothetical protein